jgi:hypothetical protein
MDIKHKALVKDLELQIDYLIGFQPLGQHWKQDYHARKELLDHVLASDDTPPEIVDKLNRILDSLDRLRSGTKHEQEYINGEADVKPHVPIKVRYYGPTGLQEWYM